MADSTESHGAEAAQGGAEAVGMPQLDFSTFPNQIFWLVVALVAIYFILDKVALPRIATILTDRQGAITNDIAAAEEFKYKAQQAEKAYEKALADARAEAGRIAQATRDEMKAELDNAMAKADEQIAAKTAESEKTISEIRANAMESVEAVAKDTAGALVSALGAQASEAEVNAAVDTQMKG